MRRGGSRPPSPRVFFTGPPNRCRGLQAPPPPEAQPHGGPSPLLPCPSRRMRPMRRGGGPSPASGERTLRRGSGFRQRGGGFRRGTGSWAKTSFFGLVVSRSPPRKVFSRKFGPFLPLVPPEGRRWRGLVALGGQRGPSHFVVRISDELVLVRSGARQSVTQRIVPQGPTVGGVAVSRVRWPCTKLGDVSPSPPHDIIPRPTPPPPRPLCLDTCPEPPCSSAAPEP